MRWRQFLSEARTAGLCRENLVVFQSCGSTNEEAARYAGGSVAEDETPAAALFIAWEQTAGRGRQGRTWHSPGGGGLYATLLHVLGPDGLADRLSAAPMLVAVAIASGLSERCGVVVRLKWPNDLMVAGKKLGGILIESRSSGAGALLLVGFGVNLVESPSGLPAQATSLRSAGAPPIAGPLLGVELAARIESRLLDPGPLAGIAAEYRACSVHRAGDTISFRAGGQLLVGELIGLDDRGCIRLLTAQGPRTLAAGEVIESVLP